MVRAIRFTEILTSLKVTGSIPTSALSKIKIQLQISNHDIYDHDHLVPNTLMLLIQFESSNLTNPTFKCSNSSKFKSLSVSANSPPPDHCACFFFSPLLLYTVESQDRTPSVPAARRAAYKDHCRRVRPLRSVICFPYTSQFPILTCGPKVQSAMRKFIGMSFPIVDPRVSHPMGVRSRADMRTPRRTEI